MSKEAALCYLQRGKLVLGVLNPKYAAWAFPGGKVEPGESIGDAAYRECVEETGATPTNMTYLYTAPGSADPGFTVHVFGCGWTGSPYTREPGNAVAWIPPEHLTASKAFGPFYEKFFQWLADGGARCPRIW